MSDYYDIDAILAEEQRVPVRFNVGSTGLGRALDPSCDDDDLKEGTEVELPFWMLPALVARGMVTAKLPRCYGERLRKELEADPGCVDLREKCEFFYDFGLRLNALLAGTGLGTFLITTFRGRYSALLARAPATAADEAARVWRRLTHEERALFSQGSNAAALFLSWRSSTHARRMAKARAPPPVPRKRLRDTTNETQPAAGGGRAR